ncbi:MAG: metallophosphoesterase [Candidatus Woesearchaeota archaeon]
MIGFIFVFLAYAGLNSYIFLRLGSLLGIKKRILFLLTAITTFAVPLSLYIEKAFPNMFSRGFYFISALWLGIFFFFICFLIIYEVIRQFYSVPHAGVIIVALVGLMTIISMINAAGIVIKEVEVPVENLEEEITIVQLTDLHLGAIRNSGFLERVIDKTEGLNPDMVLITGDMIDSSIHKNIFSPFGRINAPIYFVTGNHEVYEGIHKVYELINGSNIRVLRNEVVSEHGIQIVGIEYQGIPAIKKLDLDSTTPSVLMYHTPEGTEYAKEKGIDLQLAGHTHNGQIFPFTLLVSMRYQYVKGLYDLDDMHLYVSPGTGTWGPYMRLGSRNEITYLRLVPG